MGDPVTLTLEMIVMLSILALTIYLFAFEVLRVDVAAILIMLLLGLVGFIPGIEPLLPADRLFTGFASNAVVSIIAVMIIGAGMDKTGLMSKVAGLILRHGGRTESRIIALICGTVGVISSFMQNIGAAALFLPVVNRISSRSNIPASRLLMPMGTCAILGGTITMIGSSPLILLNDLILSANARLPTEQKMETFGLFSVTPIGVVLVIVGIIYFIVAGKFVLPARGLNRSTVTMEKIKYFQRVYGIRGELHEARVSVDSPVAAMTVREAEDKFPNMPRVLALYDGEVIKIPPDRDEVIWVNTIVGLMGDPDYVREFCEKHNWELRGEPDRFSEVLNSDHSGIAELVVPPGSSLIGHAVQEIKPRRTYGTNILQIIRNEEIIERDFADVELHTGDTLVVHVSWQNLARIRSNLDFVVATNQPYEEMRTDKVRNAVSCFGVALLLFMLTDWLSLSLMVGAVGMVVTGVLKIDEAYRAVGWQSVFLLASLIPLGIAVDQTGTATWLAYNILSVVGDVPHWVLQLIIACLATFFTLVMSNVGATVLLVPLAISIAVAVGANPALFALTVAISTSNSFILPTHQVNALLMGPGGYRVSDFMRAGGVMTVIFLVVSVTVMNLIF